MKLVVAVVLAVVGLTSGEAARPQGALLVLQQGSSGQQLVLEQRREESLDQFSQRVAERLRQEAGSEGGQYHVYLPDGRLQKVEYVAAPVKAGSSQQYSAPLRRPVQQNSQQASVQTSQSSVQVNQQQASGRLQESSEPNPVIAHFGRLQQERLQQQLDRLKAEQEELRQREGELERQLEEQRQFAANYVATIQYSQVPPIPAPIYSQGPEPLTRIVRHLY